MNRKAVAAELVKMAKDLLADGPVFDQNTADVWGQSLYDGLKRKAPVVNVQKSTLGGPQNVSLLLMVALDEKQDWPSGILENSTYFRMHLLNDGTIEHFSGNTRRVNFRKTRVRSAEEAVMKISRYIDVLNSGRVV